MMVVFLSLLILGIGLGTQLWLRSFGVWVYGLLATLAVLAVFGDAARTSVIQYSLWSHHPVSRFLLPPYEGWGYFFMYAGMRFFAPFLISFAAALCAAGTMWWINRRYHERFFYHEEYWYAALSFFLVGYPGWLVYLILLLGVYVVIHACQLLFFHGRDARISLYYLWIPAAIFAILINTYALSGLPAWGKLLL